MASSADTDNTPDLLLHHQRQVVGQGQRAKFKVTVEGSSASAVTWSREGKALKEGPKYKMYEDDGGHCLEVDTVSDEDRGTYTATVTTANGAESTTSIVLDIQEKAAEDKAKKSSPSPPPPPPPPPAPTLLSPLHDMDVVIGDRDVKLQCEVDVSEGSASSSRVRWYQEGKEVDDGDNGYRRVWNGRQASLVIRQVTPQNAGLFKCVVSNAGGEVTTSCTLSVREPEKLEPPFFIKELHDLEVEDGDKVELVVEVEGHLPIQVYWHHNNVPVTASTPGVRLHADRNVHSLVIPQATPQHGGEYVCEAYNDCGDTDSFCRLYVKEHADLDPPAFLTTPPLSLTVPEGATSALFTCRVKGHPSPAVTWTRQGNVLLTGHHYTVTGQGDTHSLQILTPLKSDAGEYVCHVHNIAGTVTSRCSLEVTETTASGSSTTVTAGNTGPSQNIKNIKHLSLSDHDKEAQSSDSLLDHNHPATSSLSSSADPSLTSTSATTTASPTTPTTQASRVRSARALGRSPTWHSTVTTPIRVGSVRKRRDWFEQRASPSPDRASQGLRRSALSLDRERQTDHAEGASSGTPDRQRRILCRGNASFSAADRQRQTSLYDSASPLDAESHDVLAPAIYQIKTVSSSVNNTDKAKSQPAVMSLNYRSTSQPGSAAESGSESCSPHTSDPQQTMESILADSPSSREDSGRKETDDPLSESSAETPRNRIVQQRAESDVLRHSSPGRMDFRSVLRNRQPQTESGTQHGIPTTEQHRTDFRSVLRKATDKQSVTRCLFPDNGAQTADKQQVGHVKQPVGGAKTDNVQTGNRHASDSCQSEASVSSSEDTKKDEKTLGQTDVAREKPGSVVVGVNTGKQDSSEPQSRNEQSVTVSGHTDITRTSTETVSEIPQEMNSVVQLARSADSNSLPESTEERYVTSARTTIKLSAPDSNCRSNTKEEDDDGGSGGVCRKWGGVGGQWEAPKVVQGLENQEVCCGGQVVMRCAVSGHPQPGIAWTHNRRDIKPSKFFQLSYQAPHAQLLIAEAFSEDEGEYTCTVSNAAGTVSSTCVLTVGGISKHNGNGDVYNNNNTESTDHVTSMPPANNVTDDVTNLQGQEQDKTTADKNRQVLSQSVPNSVEKNSGMDSVRHQREPVNDPATADVIEPTSTDDVTSNNAPDQGTCGHSRQTKVVLTPGRKFEDSYDFVREVGRGKFGSVYECRERRTGAVVAAKVLKVRGQGRKEDVRREVEVMNTLSHHPSLLLLQDAFEAERSMVLVTEFVAGGELLERVSSEQYVLTEKDCAHFLRQLCEGVTYMHSLGVLHLDLKPNNVLCLHPHSNDIKIIDFGLARFFKAGDSLHVLFGTPEFIAPEVISYDDIGFGTDMWSVGVIAYILLSGLSPFQGDNDPETLANVTQGDYDFDDDSFDIISDDAKDFISRLLLKRKEKRMSAEQCQRHAWLSRHDERHRTRRLNTENLRCFVAAHRKRWHTTAHAIMAVQRMSSLSKLMPAHGKVNNSAQAEETAHS